MTKDENVKTIRFPVKTDQKLLAIANKCGLTKLDFFIYMVDYFYKSKKDPRDLNDELLKNAINKKTDNIIAFIRTQEQELLIPTKKDSERMIASQLKIINFFNQQVIKYNDEQKAAYKVQLQNISKIADFLTKLDATQIESKNLKAKFKVILEYYISTREQMGMMTKQVEKDALIQNVRQQVNNL
ncbi:MAG: BfmA/BtgA family mobilization protein [Bacteroidota bacterium]